MNPFGMRLPRIWPSCNRISKAFGLSLLRGPHLLIFESNEPVGLDDANPLETKFEDLRSAGCDLSGCPLPRRGGSTCPGVWSRSFSLGFFRQRWRLMPLKLEPPSGMRDPFRDESKFPRMTLLRMMVRSSRAFQRKSVKDCTGYVLS